MRADANRCRRLAQTSVGAGLDDLRPRHSARFLELLRSTYSKENLRIVEARLEGRLAINLSEGVIQNAGINFDRIFGLPLINGSSVKGVARSVALTELKTKEGDERDRMLDTFVRVFGVGESDWRGDLAPFAQVDEKRSLGNARLNLPLDLKGAVTFLQAAPTNDAKIVVDITNVHTPDYYRTGRQEDLRNERPTLNYFPAVERGAEFAFPILLNGINRDLKLLVAAQRWLIDALENQGLGAKTAAGYGWFEDLTSERAALAEKERQIQEQEEAERRAREQAEAEEAARVASLSPEEKINEAMSTLAALDDQAFADKVKNISTLPEEEQRALIRLFSTKEKRDKLKTWRKRKPEMAKTIEEAAKPLGEQLP
ncbi:MAG: type III-B CRISPR module RAMP protein Cmr6 [Kiritimatiellia bacterium]